jgi:hypothetical protein
VQVAQQLDAHAGECKRPLGRGDVGLQAK